MASHIERRKFLATLLGGAAAWSLGARAQQAAMPVIGFLRDTSLADAAHLMAAFRQGLKEAGFHRRPERRDRIPLGGRSGPSVAGSSR
jgi:hypothetical protein